MLDIKIIRENPELVKEGCRLKRVDVDIDYILELDKQRRSLLTKCDELKKERNTLSAEVGKRMKNKENADDLKEKVRQLGDSIKEFEDETIPIDEKLRDCLLRTPNLPHASVPVGKSDEENKVLRYWGEKPTFCFTPKPHWELGSDLNIIQFEQGAKISGSGFIVYEGAGSRLQRELIKFMLDTHVDKHGYVEVMPPFVVNQDSMTGTGQFPKFVETDGAYKIDGDDLYLVPTAEVPVTNLHADEILDASQLPIYNVAYTPCFRREAGAAGRENRGITRIHQFDKVELVKLVKPEDSFAELEALLKNAEAILQALNLHYRIVEICTGDLGFSNTKQYDIEVWAPGMERYLEVSSCSNYVDYQARRANIRFRREPKAKPEFVHTLNGSGLALPRTMIAVLESYQQADGHIKVPEVLRNALKRDII
ncbi:MAG: serine--tRNA ligase [Candidatus Sumerlaeales bacterium]|nr:serine--tRNA ligase [Candidatus Sumerlaeales bacterium]